MNWFRRLTSKRHMDGRLDAELRHHIDTMAADYQRAGMSQEEARRRAILEFGGLEGVKEECREARGTMLVDSSLQDLRYALRTLRKSPVFAITAIATLALGIGANSAVFQVLDAVFLRVLPVPRANELAMIEIKGGNRGFGISRGDYRLTFPLFEAIREHQQGFDGVIAWDNDGFVTGIAPETRDSRGLVASGDFFRVLNLGPAAGRFFTAADDRPGCSSPGLVLSHSYWQSAYGGQASAIGQRLAVEGTPLEIIGVTPAYFSGLDVGSEFDFIIPVCAQALIHHGNQHFSRRDLFWLSVMGRLKPGWTRERAASQLASISPELFAATKPAGYSVESTARYTSCTLTSEDGSRGVSSLRGEYGTSLYVLLGLTTLILLIGCANLANLMLARASARRREFAVRMALGASRTRLVRQALAEATVLTVTGGGLGFLLANALSRAMLAALETSDGSLHLDLSSDGRLFLFALAAAAACCLIFGLGPAVAALRNDPADTIKSGGRGMTEARGRFSFQRGLIVVQIAMSLVLVTGAILLVGTFRKLVTLDPGFRTKDILIASFDMRAGGVTDEQAKPREAELLEELRAVPQVEAAAATTNIILNGGSWTLGLAGISGGWSKFTWVSSGYFDALQIRLRMGRDFTTGDVTNGGKVAIVNEAFVKRYFAGENAIGKTFRTTGEPGYPAAEYQVIGICQDTRYWNLRAVPPPQSYAPIAQHPSYRPWASFYVRSSAPLSGISQEIKRRVLGAHPGYGLDFRIFQDEVRNALVRERLLAALSGFFGFLAILIATIGLYGVVAYIVIWRRKEVGIRVALGATRQGIVALFMKEAGVLIGIGLVFGLAGAFLFARAANSLLFGVSAQDPWGYSVAVLVLAGVAALASYLPARRAAAVTPLVALREE